ncbi:MAG: glycosyltransferase family 39 protein [Sphingobium sp.]
MLAAAYVIASRLNVAVTAPLWLDETWSAMIATRPEWTGFWREAWLDCNPPLYYLFLTGWVSIFGDSNLMLRLPSFLFVFLAAILPVAWRPKGLNQTAAWTWAGLILLWPPGTLMMLDARSYALMLLLSTASCLVFARLLDQLSHKLAVAWVALGTMMFLTHYFSAVLLAAQGLVLIWRYRAMLFRIWPAAVIAVPGLGWFAIHLPRLEAYARKDVAWQQLTNVESSLGYLLYIVGALNLVFFGLILFIVICAGFDRKATRPSGAVIIAPADRDLLLVAATAVIGFGLAICIGLLQASLINRYLVPLVPPTLLGFTLILQRSARQEIAGILLTLAFLLPGINPKTIEKFAEMRGMYGYERGSDFVATYQPDKMLFVWDHPTAKILDQRSLVRIGGYFQHRASVNIPVQALVIPDSADANLVLRTAAKGKSTGIIWLYNTADRTSARNHPPSFENDPAWICRDRGLVAGKMPSLGVVACVKMEKAID